MMIFSSLLFISCLCVHTGTLDLELVTDYTVSECLQTNNDNKEYYFETDSNGFPFCASYSDDLTCDSENDSCEPGLKCNAESKQCELDTGSCFKYYANVKGNEIITDFLYPPDCLEDGSWAAKQCKGGSSGRCFCYDSSGERILGQAFAEDSSDMTCACSRRVAELSATSRQTYVTLHCDDMGNYEELQCDSGHCWCVETKTGELSSIIVPEKSMAYLSCYEKLQGSQYLRQCESLAYAQSKIIEKMEKHGSSANIEQQLCEEDGSYGPYLIDKSIVYCVTDTNSKMAYYSEKSSNSPRDCNCARDEELYEDLGKTFNLVCASGGSYSSLQTLDQTYYGCVDKDGILMVKKAESLLESYCDELYNF